jgi:hypothetical protein
MSGTNIFRNSSKFLTGRDVDRVYLACGAPMRNTQEEMIKITWNGMSIALKQKRGGPWTAPRLGREMLIVWTHL